MLKKLPAPSYYYRFHKAVNLPSNWVALGDSIMHINPVFGYVFYLLFLVMLTTADGCPFFRLGIAKALYGVISLSNSLRTMSSSSGGIIPPDFAAKFFSTQKTRIESFWCVFF